MILNASMRTDIPAFYSQWFFNRVQAGTVLVRNPYAPKKIIRYRIDPSVVDVICFCTKNPLPMLDRLNELSDYRQFWQVSMTPYGKDLEPCVPEWHAVADAILCLSDQLGKERVFWRYDPILISPEYDLDTHLRVFEEMAETLKGHVGACVISFVDLYDKTKRNLPGIREVSESEIQELGYDLSKIAEENEIPLKSCHEDHGLAAYGIDCSGCTNQQVLEHALGISLQVPAATHPRRGCDCLLSGDIGAYNTCLHGCRYCYANQDIKTVRRTAGRHHPDSELLIGRVRKKDVITDAHQESWLSRQMKLDL